MADNFNINNLELDDNTFEVLPDGDYHFVVASHEVGYATSDKMPPNTQQISCYLEIPIEKDDDIKNVSIRANLNIYKKALFAVRQFVECIGMVPEKGKMRVNLDKIDGMNGICSLTTIESQNGNEFNRVQIFYPPSKAPAVTANDDAWRKMTSIFCKSFSGVDDNGTPFI